MIRHGALSVGVTFAALALSVSLIPACSEDRQVTGPTRTAVVHVRPVDDQGRLRSDFTVTDTVAGAKCFGDSVKLGEPAHGCEAASSLYDPCWTETDGPSGPSVLCMGQPWNHDVVRLLTDTTVTRKPATPGVDTPWGVELADGQRCRYATGAHDSVGDADGDVVDYFCGEELGLALLRGIDKTHPVWTARAVRHVNGHYEPVDPQPIATAWF